jgi:hypothetical protein
MEPDVTRTSNCTANVNVQGQNSDEEGSKWKHILLLVFNIIAGTFAVLRSTFAFLTIIHHAGQRATMPFVTPLLWFDWPVIYSMIGRFSPLIAHACAIVGACFYGVCFWLTIGYGRLGFATHQYDVLDIPEYCQNLAISWQTDPRRHFFVGIHCVLFACGSIGVFGCIILAANMLGDNQFKLDLSARLWRKQRVLEIRFPLIEIMQGVVGFSIIAPALVAVIMSAVLNGHEYLVLGQQGCYGSYVSSRFSYLDQDYVDFKIKAAAWLGVLT